MEHSLKPETHSVHASPCSNGRMVRHAFTTWYPAYRGARARAAVAGLEALYHNSCSLIFTECPGVSPGKGMQCRLMVLHLILMVLNLIVQLGAKLLHFSKRRCLLSTDESEAIKTQDEAGTWCREAV